MAKMQFMITNRILIQQKRKQSLFSLNDWSTVRYQGKLVFSSIPITLEYALEDLEYLIDKN